MGETWDGARMTLRESWSDSTSSMAWTAGVQDYLLSVHTKQQFIVSPDINVCCTLQGYRRDVVDASMKPSNVFQLWSWLNTCFQAIFLYLKVNMSHLKMKFCLLVAVKHPCYTMRTLHMIGESTSSAGVFTHLVSLTCSVKKHWPRVDSVNLLRGETPVHLRQWLLMPSASGPKIRTDTVWDRWLRD